ncbi:MAG: c-type cytochrome [Sandaracinaceae bacterium]
MFDEGYASEAAERMAEGWVSQGVLAALVFVVLLAILVLAVSRRGRSLGPVAALGVVLASGVAGLFVFGLNRPPTVRLDAPDPITVRVRAYRWRWEFEQPNGMVEGELSVPVGRPVRLLITSEPTGPDAPAVMHRLSIPALGVRAMAVPGQTREVLFRADREGDYGILCTEFCGTGHSRMGNRVRVVSWQAYNTFGICSLGSSPPDDMTYAQWGEQLFSNNGCIACHNVDPHAGDGVGPNLRNVAGLHRWVEGNAYVLADDAYLQRAITEPEAELSMGYTQAAMPAFNLPQSQIGGLIAYLHSISVAPSALGTRDPYVEGIAADVEGINGRESPPD